MYKGNDEEKKNGMAHYNDLRETYAKHMEYHGCGFALFQPISARDMTPPCAGYFDRNGDWNLICNLSTHLQAQLPLQGSGNSPVQPFGPLKYDPAMSTQINIEWQPKTSQDVEAVVLSGGGQTPDNLPAGADVQIKYQSKSKFGAVLMTLRPVTLQAYNDERLFIDWINTNRSLLFDTYSSQLKKYGLWVVTRTYTAPGCSINAWQNNSKESMVSLKAKATMLGELADGEMQWNDRALDKDWSHYKAQEGDAVVVFMDGIEVPKTDWYIEGVRQKFVRSPSRSPKTSPIQHEKILPPPVGEPLAEQRRRVSAYLAPPPNGHLSSEDNGLTTAHVDVGVMPTWSENTAGPTTHGGTQPKGSTPAKTSTPAKNSTPPNNTSPSNTSPSSKAQPRNSTGSGYLINSPIQKQKAEARVNSGFGYIFTKMDAPAPWDANDPNFNSPVDHDTLKDAGFQPLNLSRRSLSVRRHSGSSSRPASIAPSEAPSDAGSAKTAATSAGVAREKSLRRETRSVSGESIKSSRRVSMA